MSRLDDRCCNQVLMHYSDVIMNSMTPQITSLTIVYSTVYSGADKWKHQSSASLVFGRGIHRWPINSPHKGPVTSWTEERSRMIQGQNEQLIHHGILVYLTFCNSFRGIGKSFSSFSTKWPLFYRRYFQFILLNKRFRILFRILLRFCSSPIDNKSALVQVQAEQVTSHYLYQCWLSLLTHI